MTTLDDDAIKLLLESANTNITNSQTAELYGESVQTNQLLLSIAQTNLVIVEYLRRTEERRYPYIASLGKLENITGGPMPDAIIPNDNVSGAPHAD